MDGEHGMGELGAGATHSALAFIDLFDSEEMNTISSPIHLKFARVESPEP